MDTPALVMAREMFEASAALHEYHEVLDYWDWLKFWSGPEWGDTPPNRLFGSWVMWDGCAT